MRVHRYEDISQIEEIGPSLFRVKIPQPFYEPNNVHVLTGPEPALIDSGYVQNLGLLQGALRTIGLSLGKIRHIFYTHDHLDHITAALVMRFYSNAKLYGMQGMSHAVGDYTQHMNKMQRAMDRLIYKAHSDPAVRAPLLARFRKGWTGFLQSVHRGEKVDPILRMDAELVEGDVVPVGNRELGFLYTPGHNCWHLSPYILGEGIYFTGDLVLQNVSSVYAELDGNLSDYHQSLDRLLRLPIRRLLPAHGAEPKDPQRQIRLVRKTLALMERGVIRRLKGGQHDLHELAVGSMGEKIVDSGHYPTALAVIHSIIQKLMHQGHVRLLEVDPPYERYEWTGSAADDASPLS